MIDREDMEALGIWVVRGAGACLFLILIATSLGAAARIFEFVAGR